MSENTDHSTTDHSTSGAQEGTIGIVQEDAMPAQSDTKNGIINRTRAAVGSKIPSGISATASSAASRVGDAASTTGSWLAARREDTIDAVVARTTPEQRRNSALAGVAVVAVVIAVAVCRRRSS